MGLTAASKKIDYTLLLQRLQRYGIVEVVLNQFLASYLKRRTRPMIINTSDRLMKKWNIVCPSFIYKQHSCSSKGCHQCSIMAHYKWHTVGKLFITVNQRAVIFPQDWSAYPMQDSRDGGGWAQNNVRPHNCSDKSHESRTKVVVTFTLLSLFFLFPLEVNSSDFLLNVSFLQCNLLINKTITKCTIPTVSEWKLPFN